MNFKDEIRIIDGFPKEGISFKDITTLVKDKDAYKAAIDSFASYLKDKNIDVVVAPEARGFIFGAPLAYAIGAGFVPVRKKGKLPCETVSEKYDLEYGTDELEIHKDAIKPNMRVAIVDDLLATGGTIAAVANLVERLSAKVVSIDFVIELTDLNGRDKLKNYDVMSIVTYNV